jgi:CRP/FNR family transcriptional regulator
VGSNDRQFWSSSRRRLVPVTEKARLADMLHMMRLDTDQSEPEDMSAMLPVWCVRKDAPLFHEGSPTDTLYVLRSGSLKCVKSSEDGYHQVLSFVGPGEVLGFESLHRGQHRTSAIALEVSTVFAIPVQTLGSLRQQSPLFDEALQNAISRQLDGAGDMAELMAAVAADARLARFLMWLSARMTAAGQSAHRLRLRMCRRDIASLLGVAHETVSRSFTNLADDGLVQVLNRDVDILDFEGLRQRARCTRGVADDNAAAVCMPHAKSAPPRTAAKPRANTARLHGFPNAEAPESATA